MNCRRFVPLLAVALGCASAVAAAEPAPTEITLDRGHHALVQADFGAPFGASAGVDWMVGLGADVREENERVKAVCAAPIAFCARGFLVHAAAGTGGGKLAVGIGGRAHVEAEDFHGNLGAVVRLAVARTWGNPIGTEPGVTYLGPETDLTLWRLGLTVGTLWRVGGGRGDRLVFSWGLGLRL
jgi:hypothetical protein